MGQTISLDLEKGAAALNKLDEEWVIVGRLGAPNGLKGAIRLHSFTVPEKEIFTYKNWQINLAAGWTPVELIQFELRPKGFLLYLKGHSAPETLAPWVNREIGVRRSELRPLPKGEYYWVDLIGLAVETEQNQPLGSVTGLMAVAKGSADLLIVQGERVRYIPYIPGEVVLDINLSQKRMVVAWDPEL